MLITDTVRHIALGPAGPYNLRRSCTRSSLLEPPARLARWMATVAEAKGARMTDRNVMPEQARSTADWLRHAAEVLRRISHDATPGPWRWGDPAAIAGMLEQDRITLERSPMHTAFPAVRRRDDDGEPVLPALRDPLDLFEDAVNAVSPRVHANARWITVLTPSIAEPLASLLEALAGTAEQITDAGGSVATEPYLSAVVLAKRIVEAAEGPPHP